MSTVRRSSGFTLLEVVIALAVLALSLMAIFDLNAGAVSMHAYTKKVTVASLLARSKMTDIEQELHDKGFPADDEERSGDFSDEGWSSFKWRAKLIAPKTTGVSTDQLLGAIFNLPTGGEGGDAMAGIASMFGSPGGGQGGGPAAAAGPMAGLAQAQMTQFLDQISKTVREVHLTVTWKDGKQVESVDLVTHIVSLGPGSDRNGRAGPGGQSAPGSGDVMVNARTGVPVPNPAQDASGRMVDPANPADLLIPLSQFQAMRGAQGGAPGGPHGASPLGGGKLLQPPFSTFPKR